MTTTTPAKRTPVTSAETRTLVLEHAKRACAPVTSCEVAASIQATGNDLSHWTVKQALRELVRDGHLYARPERNYEREIRSKTGIKHVPGKPELLYWTSAHVPVRQRTEVIPGIVIFTEDHWAQRDRAKRAGARGPKPTRPAKQAAKQTGKVATKSTRPAKAPAVQTGNRIDRLEKRIHSLEAMLDALSKALR